MINCAFLIFKKCYHCIKESISFFSGWFCLLNSIHALKKKCTIIFIDRNIGVRYFEPVEIIEWLTDTEYFMNGNIFIMKYISDIHNPGSESIHNHNSNDDYEGVRICYWTVGLIKTNNFNMRTTIYTVA